VSCKQTSLRGTATREGIAPDRALKQTFRRLIGLYNTKQAELAPFRSKKGEKWHDVIQKDFEDEKEAFKERKISENKAYLPNTPSICSLEQKNYCLDGKGSPLRRQGGSGNVYKNMLAVEDVVPLAKRLNLATYEEFQAHVREKYDFPEAILQYARTDYEPTRKELARTKRSRAQDDTENEKVSKRPAVESDQGVPMPRCKAVGIEHSTVIQNGSYAYNSPSIHSIHIHHGQSGAHGNAVLDRLACLEQQVEQLRAALQAHGIPIPAPAVPSDGDDGAEQLRHEESTGISSRKVAALPTLDEVPTASSRNDEDDNSAPVASPSRVVGSEVKKLRDGQSADTSSHTNAPTGASPKQGKTPVASHPHETPTNDLSAAKTPPSWAHSNSYSPAPQGTEVSSPLELLNDFMFMGDTPDYSSLRLSGDGTTSTPLRRASRSDTQAS
jgi:hypothetical protein